MPDNETLITMQITSEHVFEPLRNHFNEQIYVSSFYRSPELNQAIGGSKTSQHCLGEAIDIDDVYITPHGCMLVTDLVTIGCEY